MLYGLLCAVFLIIIIALCIKIYLMKKSVKEIANTFCDILQTDTNTLIKISSSDKDIRYLANSINTQLKILRKEYHRYTQGDAELKTAITNISHDLRTPLTAICGYLDLMKRAEADPQTNKYLEIISDRTELMKQLTEELFKYSVIISGENPLAIEEVFVNQVLEESISGYYAVLTKKGIVPKIDITENKIIKNLNKSSLSRVFSNLLNNAVKYSDGNLEITLAETGEITFSNTAKSLSAIDTERLFDRFYTVETARNSTGLGLSIARVLVEQMRGKISAEYKENTFLIRLMF